MSTKAVASAVVAASALIAQASAYSSYMALIPNGDNFGKALGHTDTGYTDFGTMFSDAGTEWSAVCSETYPGSSVTVGAALGDPCCTWTEGGTPDFVLTEVDTDGTKCASSSAATTTSAAASSTGSTTADTATTTDTTADTTASSNATASTAEPASSDDGSYCE